MAYILVADDQEKIRQMLKSLFEQYGHEVTLAANGKEALSKFQPDKIDLVVTDILMPDMEGIETIRELQKIKSDVKIIAMSGGGTVGAMEYLRIAGMFGAKRTIEKPFDVREMLTAVDECLKD
jgi:DNA-binding NtrC family response regulator